MGEQTSQNQHGRYGAPLTNRQFIVLITAIVLGTLLEWYEFFVYAQLNPYLTKLFFPSNDLAVQQLSYWGVYAVGFIARPIGSIIFGHIGDTRGRRLNLLLTITIMAVPTVLIGCLPTYEHIGIAAPALLAVLRLVQGLAMGGEFGSAMVYLHEIAPASMKGMIGSLGFVSSMFGCMLGVLIVVIMEALCNPDQMLVFGWRIPFLLSAVSASAAVALRMHMPEPQEFVEERQAVTHHHLQQTANKSLITGDLSQSWDGKCASCKPLHVCEQHAAAVSSPADRSTISDVTTVMSKDTTDVEVHHSTKYLEKGLEGMILNHSNVAPTGGFIQNTSFGADLNPETSIKTPAQNADMIHGLHMKAPASAAPAGTSGETRQYIPVVQLLRKHTPAVLLQFLFEAWVSVGFWLITTWLPLQMKKPPINMPGILTQAMLITNLVIMGGVQLAAGWSSDRGVPRVWLCFSVFTLAAGISCPVLLAMPTTGVAGAWLIHTLLMVIMACVFGVIPATLSSIYPATVRATGFNLGHNMAMSWLGGVSPTVVTALVAATGHAFLAPGLLLTVSAVVSMLAALALVWYAPQANKNPGTSKVDTVEVC